MKNILASISPLYEPFAKQVLPILQANGIQIRAVGGCVRDALLDIPINDVDFCTTALPDELIALEPQFGNNIKVLPTGLDHGTVTFLVFDEFKRPCLFEVTTLRIDEETDGRHAKVKFTADWKQDAQRRDFTINAMSVDLFTGELFDYFNGVDDLMNRKLIMFVGKPQERITEDNLRILRGIRFVSKLGFRFVIEDNLFAAFMPTFKDNVSAERTWMELKKMCVGQHFHTAICFAAHWDVLKWIELGFLQDKILDKTNIEIENLTKRLTYENIVMETPHPNTPCAFFGAVIDTSAQLESARKYLRWSNQEYNMIKFIVDHKNDTGVESSKYYYDHLIDGVHPDIVQCYVKYQVLKGAHPNIGVLLAVKDFLENPKIMPVTGDDLIAMGFKEGKEFGMTMKALKQRWKDSVYSLSKEELLADVTL